VSVLPSPDQKPAYVNEMFSAIAGRYDLLNRVMTFGLDRGWRMHAVRYVVGTPDVADGRVLDVATGTGDFLPLLHTALPGALVVGADFCLPMMQAGMAKLDATEGQGAYLGGDALRLPFEDNTFDAVTTGFGMRNVADLSGALAEMQRVTKPGGRFACLEVARPSSALLRLGHRVYFTRIVPLLGALLGGNGEAYTYLPQSAERFPPPEHFRDLLKAAGWRHVRYDLLGLGAVAVHIAEK
jgi:demethylmenaquinone methyltransferase/2-methoxy-6-polyprenyl-1,4-benzoquinol methylase